MNRSKCIGLSYSSMEKEEKYNFIYLELVQIILKKNYFYTSKITKVFF